ncbi:hypothetical protein ABPG74_014199 [Tetrahymena malaccensis]
MSEKIQQTLANTSAALGGLVMEECNFNYNLQQNVNNIQTQNYFSTASSLPQSGVIYSNSFNSQQLSNSIKINTLNIFGESGNNNDPNFFMNSFEQEPSSPRNDYAYIIKKEYCFCDQPEQQQLFQNTQNFDFFNEKQNNSFNNNNLFIQSSKNQFGNNQSNNSKNNNQGDKCLSLFFDCSPSVNPFTQGINNNIYPQEQQQQQQQQNQLGLCQNMNNANQNIFSDIPQLMKADSIVDGIQNEIPAHFLQDISFERSQRIQQTRFAESGKSYQFENSFNLAGFQQSQSSQNGVTSQSQNQILSLFKQNQIFSNYPQDQYHNIAEEINLQINTKKEEESQSNGNFNPKQDQYYNLNGYTYQDDQNENYNYKGIDQVSNRESSTRSLNYFNQNQPNNIVSATNIESSQISVNDDEESKSSKITVSKKKRICKQKEQKSKEIQSRLAVKLETERIVEQKEDRKRGKKTLYYKGSDGKQKKFARITKSMIRPVCNAVCKHLRSYGAKVEKIDWLNQLRSFLIENSKFIPTAVDFFQNHFEKYVNSSPKLIEKSEYLLFKDNWIRGVSDPANFKGLKQIK